MTTYAFVINHRTCIGCHACTVACKSENEVPVGSFRTWVKYVETGSFPESSRHFAVLRCNQCRDAPCMTICPVTALFRREDGIVDFDQDLCIGCKSCMQACPYDALYVNPRTNTAEKCNFCAHRVDVGLKPACEIVCPERAILSGDLDDPRSEVSRLVEAGGLSVRKPEAGTRPKVYYVDVEPAAIDPAATRPTANYLWSQGRPDASESLLYSSVPEMAQDVVRKVYDVDHPQPWGWKVSAYLWTKAIAAGSLVVGAAAVTGGDLSVPWRIGAPVVALAFLMATTLLLVLDLKRPERFLRLLLKPNWSSWLVRGGYVLVVYGGLATAWLAAGVFREDHWLRVLAWPTAVVALAAAGYSAFLFRQCRGRAFWRSPLLLWDLLATALAAGGAATALLPLRYGSDDVVRAAIVGGLVAHAVIVLFEVLGRHPNVDAAKAAGILRSGPLSGPFWAGAFAAGILLPLALVWLSPIAAAFAVLAGLWVYEHLWIVAGQSVPLS